MNKILFDEMAKIVEKNVKYYKTDFYELDVKTIENYDSDEFIWIVREAGTLILNINNLKFRNSLDFIHLSHYKNHSNVKLYKVNTKTLKIKKLDYSKMLQEVINNLQEPKEVELTIDNENYIIDLEEFLKVGFLDRIIKKYHLENSVAVGKIKYVF